MHCPLRPGVAPHQAACGLGVTNMCLLDQLLLTPRGTVSDQFRLSRDSLSNCINQ